MKNLSFRDKVELHLLGLSFAVTLMLAASDAPLLFLCGLVVSYLLYRRVDRRVGNQIDDE